MSSWEETLCRSRHLVSSGAFDKLFGDKYFIFDAIKVHLFYDVTLSLLFSTPVRTVPEYYCSGQISSALQLFKNSNLYWIIYSGGYFYKKLHIYVYIYY